MKEEERERCIVFCVFPRRSRNKACNFGHKINDCKRGWQSLFQYGVAAPSKTVTRSVPIVSPANYPGCLGPRHERF